MAVYIIVAIIAYIVGSFNISILISKKVAGFDVREKGSGGTGATNMLRSVGKIPALITLIWDVLKGVISIGITLFIAWITGTKDVAFLVQIAGIFVIIGHTFPIFFGFKGGKGVATSLGVLLMTNWQIGLICLVFAIVLMALTRMVSVGSIMAAILFPVLTLFIGSEHFIVKGNYFVFSLIIAVIVIFNHRQNIKRIVDGKENKLSFKK